MFTVGVIGKRTPLRGAFKRMILSGILVGTMLAASAARRQSEVVWREDVSHASIPGQPAAGMIGTKRFTVTRALLHASMDASGKHKEVAFYTLELTAQDGTPGADFVLAVTPGSHLDGKTLWRRSMMEHSAAVSTGKGMGSVSYPPFQAVWLHGDRDPNFKLMKVFKQIAVQNYTARIEFGKAQGGKLPGRIYFCGKPDTFWKAPKSVLAGAFTATILPVGK